MNLEQWVRFPGFTSLLPLQVNTGFSKTRTYVHKYVRRVGFVSRIREDLKEMPGDCTHLSLKHGNS